MSWARYAVPLFLGLAACQQTNVGDNQQAQGDNSSGAAASADNAASAEDQTNFQGVNLSDTTEDASYVSQGEDLARTTGQDVIGKPAPRATMKTIDGQTINLDDVYGKKPVYIKFWATWCVPCRQQMPAFEKVYETLGDKIEVIAVDIGLSDDEASIRTFRQKYGLKMPIVMDDGRLGALFHLGVTPQHVLIGKDVRFDYIGHADNASLEQAIQKAVSAPETGKTAAAAQSVAVEQVVAPGQIVPPLSVKTTDGTAMTLRARPGRLLAVEFTSSWCEWYLESSRPGTSKACARAREAIGGIATQNKTIDWVGIAGGPWATEGDLKDYMTKNKVSIPFVLDKKNSIFRTFGVRDIPTVALIDATGRLVKLIGPQETDLAGALRSAQSNGASGSQAR